MLGWSIYIFGTLVAAAVRRNLEAGLWLVPLVSASSASSSPSSLPRSAKTPNRHTASPLTFDAGPIPIHISSVGDFAGILVIVLILFFRFMHIFRDQEHATTSWPPPAVCRSF